MNRKSLQIVMLLVFAFIALGAGIKLALDSNMNAPAKVSEFTQLYETPRAIKPFTLTDTENQVFDNASLKGHWSLLFLGYMSCPDVCPTTMMKLTQILPSLREVDPSARVVFLSVDPKRDTTEKVGQYKAYFDDSIVGLRAEHKELYPFVRNLGLMYSIPPQEVEAGYFVDHSGSIVLINPDGQIHAMFKPKVAVGEVPSVDENLVVQDFTNIVGKAE
jgi:protein SCO1